MSVIGTGGNDGAGNVGGAGPPLLRPATDPHGLMTIVRPRIATKRPPRHAGDDREAERLRRPQHAHNITCVTGLIVEKVA